jgi:hypothetical protein
MSFKICFLTWHYKTPEIFLNVLLKMTPGRKGVWKDMIAVTDPFEADYCAIMDGYSGKFPQDRAIYFGEHPDCTPSYRLWENTPALAKISLDKYLNPGEWWISHDYDMLMRMDQPSSKSEQLACIVTYQLHHVMYTQRQEFLRNLVRSYPDIRLDLYGRPSDLFYKDQILSPYYKGPLGLDKPDWVNGEHLSGKELLVNYRFSLEFDQGPTRNYFSERFYDAMLLWVHPIYFGSNNIHKWIPQESFSYIDIFNTDDVDEARTIIMEGIDYSAIREARNLLLNKYQIWPAIYDVIRGL